MSIFKILICGLLLTIVSSCASPAKVLKRNENRAKQEKIDYQAFLNASEALKAENFVLEANRVIFRLGQSAMVTPNTNFVSLVNGRAIIQLAFNTPTFGANGMGGITVDGKASNIKMTTNKKGDILYSMMVIGYNISADVSLTMTKGSNVCRIIVNPNLNSNRLTFVGHLYPSSESRVYKGMSY